MDFLKNEKDEESKVVYAGSFEDTEAIRHLSIEEGILEIGENAFRGFSHLESVELPLSLKKISACAFAECKNLKRVVMKSGIEEILDEAFSSCSSLPEIIIPETVKRIGEGAFEGCVKLKFVTIPKMHNPSQKQHLMKD